MSSYCLGASSVVANVDMTGVEIDVDTVRESLLEQLQLLKDVRDLQEICNGLNVNIPLVKQGKLSAVRSLLLRHLTSAEVEGEDDEGLAVFQDVLRQVQAKLEAKAAVEVPKTDGAALGDGSSATVKTKPDTPITLATPAVTKPKPEAASTSASQNVNGQTMVRVDQIRLNKDFKLGGTVGGSKNSLGYGTIYYRMMEGLSNGWKEKEIMAGVVNAFQAESELGQWFVGHPELEWNEFLEILRNHFQLENYGWMLMNLGKEFQKPNEEAIGFAYRMTRLRDDILVVAAHENAVVERKMVQERCLHGLLVGLRSNTIRMELRQVLSDQSIKDTVLFREVTAASKREKEYQEMHEEQQEVQVNSTNTKSNKKKTASAAAMDATVDDKTSLAILQQLEKLATSNEQLCAQMKKREDEMSNMKNEFEQLKKKVGNNRGPPKCPVCQVSGARCFHCAHCGKDGHKIKDCPEKN